MTGYAAGMAGEPDAATRAQAEAAILDLLAVRDPGKTICPSDAARALGGDDGFRPLMPLVRDAARARGAIRLRALPPSR